MAEVELRSSGDITLRVGDVLVVRLPENATTGYQWQAREIPPPLRKTDDRPIPPATERPGASGEHLFRFETGFIGDGRLTLTLNRPWEDQPRETTEIRIMVTSDEGR